ncbi:MAG: YlxR family protein [Armatimonadetes bacterium]|nr:YlxR family protein [Armatimonadota bacterium]
MDYQRKVPIRTCVSCRDSSAKNELIRIVRSVDGVVRIDPSGKLPGRGAYLCGAKKCLAQALKANKLNRALRCEIPESLKVELGNLVVKEDTGNELDGDGDYHMKAE